MSDEEFAEAIERNRPPKNEPNTALIINLDSEQYLVLDFTGRFFYSQLIEVGFTGEEIGISNVPEEPGYWVMENGKVWTSKDWETGLVDDYGIEGDFRRPTIKDFADRGIELPIDIKAWDL